MAGFMALKYLFAIFFFNDTATTEIYTLSLHDALPILIPAIGASQNGLLAFAINPGAWMRRVLFFISTISAGEVIKFQLFPS